MDASSDIPDWGAKGLSNYHMHTVWCDGKDTAEAMALSAIDQGFREVGFSSHAMLPLSAEGYLSPVSALGYADEIRALKAKYSGRISVLLGVEADYVRGLTAPNRALYAHLGVEYVIGSIHFVMPPGATGLDQAVCVDMSPESLRKGIDEKYEGDVRAYVVDYFAQEREMVLSCDFDIVGHPDLIRKFNGTMRYLDEGSVWYMGELEATADAIARSGKIVEINTGAISRGWMDDAYPSSAFLSLLKARGVKAILSSDAHSAKAIGCAFERFAPLADF